MAETWRQNVMQMIKITIRIHGGEHVVITITTTIVIM
jgi:hypothetical protein